MPPPYTVRPAGDFASLMVKIPDAVRNDIVQIVNALRADAHFVPSETEYKITRSDDGQIFCTKVDGWHGLFLIWHLEFAADRPDQPVVVLMMRAPIVLGVGQETGTRDMAPYPTAAMPTAPRGGGMAYPPAPAAPAIPKRVQQQQQQGQGEDLPQQLQQQQVQQQETDEEFRPPAYAPPPPMAAPRKDSSGKMLKRVRDMRDPNLSYVRVFYSTDREQVTLPGLPPEYGPGRSQAGELHYGECEVSIPKTHKLGKLESPSILRLEFSPDPQKHIVLASIESLEE